MTERRGARREQWDSARSLAAAVEAERRSLLRWCLFDLLLRGRRELRDGGWRGLAQSQGEGDDDRQDQEGGDAVDQARGKRPLPRCAGQPFDANIHHRQITLPLSPNQATPLPISRQPALPLIIYVDGPERVNRSLSLLALGLVSACSSAPAASQHRPSPSVAAPTPTPAPPSASPSSRVVATPTAQGGTITGPTVLLVITASGFQPVPVHVRLGSVLKLVNQDGETHSCVADDGSFDSGVLSPGAMWLFKPTRAGVFLFHDNAASGWRGQLDVDP